VESHGVRIRCQEYVHANKLGEITRALPNARIPKALPRGVNDIDRLTDGDAPINDD
jgi:hypothetical protein